MKVLQVSQDPMVLQSRALLLMQALPGCEVVSVCTYAEAVAACSAHVFDLAVLGTGLSDADKMRVGHYVCTAFPNAKVIDIHHGVPLLREADFDWEAGMDPSALVEGIRRTMNRLAKAAAATPKY
jgi:hypothetical protein